MTKAEKNAARRARRAQDEQRAQQRAVRARGGGVPPFDHYIVVLSSTEATQIANVLARLGLALDGTTLRVGDGDDVLFDITPREIANAHAVLLDALHERWLGVHDSTLS